MAKAHDFVDHEAGNGDHYDTFAATLRQLFVNNTGGSVARQYFLSAAPLCVNKTAILPSSFYAQTDFVWVRFYNAKCALSSSFSTYSIVAWYSYLANLRAGRQFPKLYIGALSFNNTAFDKTESGFIEASTFVQEIEWLWSQTCASIIGGVMLWDGTFGLGPSSFDNLSYNDAAKFGMDNQHMKC